MINDLTDLEPLLAQYDPGKVLIGPLLNLSINSSFRFFYIAGNGPKIYESYKRRFCRARKRRTEATRRYRRDIGEPFRRSANPRQPTGTGTGSPFALAK